MPSLRYLLAFVALTAVLAAGGCDSVNKFIDETMAKPNGSGEAPAAGGGPERPGGKDQTEVARRTPETGSGAGPPALQAARPPATGRPAAPDAIATRELLGQTEVQVVDLLGMPKTVRNEPPAMVWNYSTGACKFDLFFYFDINNQDFRALSYRFDPGKKTPAQEELCLSAIRRGNAVTKK